MNLGKKRKLQSYWRLTKQSKTVILENRETVIKFPYSRGGSGALYLQSAIVGVIFHRGRFIVRLHLISGVDVWVLRDGNLRTVSGQECSSTKQDLPGAVRVLEPS